MKLGIKGDTQTAKFHLHAKHSKLEFFTDQDVSLFNKT